MGIISFIQAYQLYIMFFMCGTCAVLVYLTAITGALSKRRRVILMVLETSAMLLLFNDCLSYLYRGDVSRLGYWMVRISNFLVYFFTVTVPFVVSLYLEDLYMNEGHMDHIPKRLWFCRIPYAIGVGMLVLSQFTGLYYTFDEFNRYQRAPLNILCYVMPIVIVVTLLTVLTQHRRLISKRMSDALTLHLVLPVVASFIQLFTYGISLTNMTMVGMAIYLYICAIHDMNDSLQIAKTNEIEAYRETERRSRTMFEQTAAALANAIDAKDEYTHGHSSRVAMYSQLIAQDVGMTEEEVDEVYFAALLHDVGKIGVSDAIITKDGRLTDEEFEQIKLHPVYGYQILSNIHESPYLSVGAHYHHERYDGRGYPEGLKGEEIPEIARIIGVADAYDAMTSQRSYRDVRPQHLVREEILKGLGTQFDPHFGKIMLHYMDMDFEYNMHQKLQGVNADFVEGLNAKLETELRCDELYHDCSTGIRIIDRFARFQFTCISDEGYSADEARPSLLVFDSLDGMVHETGVAERARRYYEYAMIHLDGSFTSTNARKVETNIENVGDGASGADLDSRTRRYDIEAVRIQDHMMLRISDGNQTMQAILALPYAGRFTFLSLTGEHCSLSDMQVTFDEESLEEGFIPRIAEEVSYISGYPEGDIPNVQIAGHRARTSQSIPLKDSLMLSFHAQALPNARIIWHCPYISIFSSSDGTLKANDYKELLLVRLDGEELVDNILVETEGTITVSKDFQGWDTWKEQMKQGVDCEATIRRTEDLLTVSTSNLGVTINSRLRIPPETSNLYVAFTGDQCSITNIRIL